MTFPCFHCGRADAHTNGGALFCWECLDVLTEEEKDADCERHLGPDHEGRIAA